MGRVCFDFVCIAGCLSSTLTHPALYHNVMGERVFVHFSLSFQFCLHPQWSLTFLFLTPLFFLLFPRKATNDSIPYSLSIWYPFIPFATISYFSRSWPRKTVSLLSVSQLVQVKSSHSHLKVCLCGTVKNDKLLQCQRSWLNASPLSCRANADAGDQTVVAHLVDL